MKCYVVERWSYTQFFHLTNQMSFTCITRLLLAFALVLGKSTSELWSLLLLWVYSQVAADIKQEIKQINHVIANGEERNHLLSTLTCLCNFLHIWSHSVAILYSAFFGIFLKNVTHKFKSKGHNEIWILVFLKFLNLMLNCSCHTWCDLAFCWMDSCIILVQGAESEESF